ncbi:MAG: type 2 isopentenyl-diphosphate Delta-isomerase [Legionella sp.]|nr:type 2 isopentenyl-diphosphate Delta-isomerase [Legionella sp.]
MQECTDPFEKRKQDHIKLALMDINQATEMNAFDTITLQHEALPDLNFEDIDLTAQRFGTAVPKPFFVSSMTAGHEQSMTINRNLVSACAQNHWAMGVGSQRRELNDHTAAKEWELLRKSFPNVSLFSNLGISQLITSSLDQIQRLIDALQAAALIIHCNPLQELIQPEGTPQFKGCWEALEKITQNLTIPIVIKETGCGFSPSTLKKLNRLGIAAVDVSGSGGTHWGRIEGHRAEPGSIQQKAAQTFQRWGVNTVQSIVNAVVLNPHFEIWGSGGVRHGLDAAKLIALGANAVGFAKPLLEAALVSADAVNEKMLSIEYELKIAMFCTGSRMLIDLRQGLFQATACIREEK